MGNFVFSSSQQPPEDFLRIITPTLSILFLLAIGTSIVLSEGFTSWSTWGENPSYQRLVREGVFVGLDNEQYSIKVIEYKSSRNWWMDVKVHSTTRDHQILASSSDEHSKAWSAIYSCSFSESPCPKATSSQVEKELNHLYRQIMKEGGSGLMSFLFQSHSP